METHVAKISGLLTPFSPHHHCRLLSNVSLFGYHPFASHGNYFRPKGLSYQNETKQWQLFLEMYANYYEIWRKLWNNIPYADKISE